VTPGTSSTASGCHPPSSPTPAAAYKPSWLFNELEPVDGLITDMVLLSRRWGETWHRIADRGYHVDSVFNIDRFMRLPGTFNTKAGDANR
jgi:hypothetical protein